MRKVFSIAWNDIKIEFSERSTLVFFLLLPIVFTFILGTALGNMGGGGEVGDGRYPILVADEDRSDLSRELLAGLNASEVVRPVEADAGEIAARMEEGQASAALLVPPGFGQSIIAGDAVTLTLRTSPEDNTALAVEQETRAVLSRLDGAATAAHAALAQADALGVLNSEAKRQEYFESSLVQAKALLEDPPALVEVVYAPQARIVEIAGGFDLASPGQLVTWTLITLLGASDVFVNERLGGTLRRLLSTPTRKATILLGKVSGRLFMGLLQMTLLIGFGAAVFRVNWGSSPAALALLVVAFALAAVALGVLLGAFSKTRSQAAGLTIFSSMVMAALGGAWWPLEITPPAYQAAVRVLPSTWAMTGFSDVILRGQGVQQVLPEVGMLLLFAAVFFTVGLARLRFE